MPTDISEMLKNSSKWSRSQAIHFTQMLLSEFKGYKMDWDEDAGESWIGICDRENVLAIIHAERNIVFFNALLISLDFKPLRSICAIGFHTYSELGEFEIDPELISTYFNIDCQAWIPIDFDPKSFSVNDLCFMTV